MPRARGPGLPVAPWDPFEDQRWKASAVCHPSNGHDPALWWPTIEDTRWPGNPDLPPARKMHETEDSTFKARALCQTCPVRGECLSAALRRRERWGVWGGLMTKDREALLKRQNVA